MKECRFRLVLASLGLAALASSLGWAGTGEVANARAQARKTLEAIHEADLKTFAACMRYYRSIKDGGEQERAFVAELERRAGKTGERVRFGPLRERIEAAQAVMERAQHRRREVFDYLDDALLAASAAAFVKNRKSLDGFLLRIEEVVSHAPSDGEIVMVYFTGVRHLESSMSEAKPLSGAKRIARRLAILHKRHPQSVALTEALATALQEAVDVATKVGDGDAAARLRKAQAVIRKRLAPPPPSK